MRLREVSGMKVASRPARTRPVSRFPPGWFKVAVVLWATAAFLSPFVPPEATAAPATTLPRSIEIARPGALSASELLQELARRPIMPLGEVKAGMEGEAWTVFQGTIPEPFKVRVVAVLRSFLPKQDLVLVRAEDPRVEHSGIVAGMSGSPVYIDKRLVGAIAYAWSFAKEPLGGVTPIASMLADAARPLHGGAKETGEPPAAPEPAIEPLALGPHTGAESAGPRETPATLGTPHLQRVGIALSFAGFPQRVLDDAAPWLDTLGLTAWQGGGTGRANSVTTSTLGGATGARGAAEATTHAAASSGGAQALRPTASPPIGPGSAIGVELVRGDMSAMAVGTVTTLLDGGRRLLAFGHPMMNAGEMALPLVSAEIHTFLPSLSQSFKMASRLGSVGVLEQDRPSCIVGKLGTAGEMIPVTATLTSPHSPPRVFRTEIARNRRLTPSLASLVLAAAVADAVPDVTDLTAAVVARVSLRGRPVLVLSDQLFSSDGLSARALAGTRLVRALSELPVNAFAPLDVDGIDVKIALSFQHDVAEIVGVALPGRVLRAGETVPVRVTLRPYGGAEYDESWPVTLPRQAAGREIKLEVAAGAQVKPDLAPPESLADWLGNLAAGFPAKSAVISVRTDAESLTLRGQLLAGLPAAALDTARPGQSSRRGESIALVVRTPFATNRVLTGRKDITVALGHETFSGSVASPTGAAH